MKKYAKKVSELINIDFKESFGKKKATFNLSTSGKTLDKDFKTNIQVACNGETLQKNMKKYDKLNEEFQNEVADALELILNKFNVKLNK